MSAFIVSDETMQRAVEGIRLSGMSDFLGYFTDTQGEEIGQILFDLNAEAVHQRYPQHEPKFPVYRHCFPPRSGRRAKIEGYKALCCVRYQCSEGDLPRRPEYQALCEVIALLAAEIVSELPEYQAAPWDRAPA
jgi:hypothetical protein